MSACKGSGICLNVVKELWCVVIQLSFMCCNIIVVTEEGYFFYIEAFDENLVNIYIYITVVRAYFD